MPAIEHALTKADFDRCRWEQALAEAEKKDTRHYSMQFGKRFRQAKEAGDEVAAAVYTVLWTVTEVELRPDEIDQPFGPTFVGRAARGVAPNDLTDEQYEILRELAPAVADAEMRARLCDIVWIMKRDYQLAKKAVEAYLESARVWEDPKNWVACEDRLRRAVRLAKSLGGGGSAEIGKTIGQVEDLLARLNGEDPSFLTCQLMELLQAAKQGDPVKYAALAEKAAHLAEAAGVAELRRARHYWRCAADWHGLAKDAEKKIAALSAAAETYVKQAEDAVSNSPTPNLSAAGELERAIHALRRVGTPAAVERADVLYLRLVEHQKKSVSELLTVNHTVDLTEIVSFAERAVTGLPLDVALQRVALLITIPSKATLRSQVERQFKSDPLWGLFSGATLDPKGKIVARRPGIGTSDEAKEAAIKAEMYRNAVHHRMIVAQGHLVAAIQKIGSEHHVRLDDFYGIAASSAFVPHGRELTVAKGLYAGFNRDIIVSTHLLIPQIEESIRMQLAERGVITSGFNRQNAQTEYDLNTTLYMEGIEQLYDEDTVFDLRGLLVEQFGSNLRNLMAHGLLSDAHLQSDAPLYLWGLALRLCVMLLPAPETVPAGGG